MAPKGAVCSLRKLLVAQRSSFAFDYSINNSPEVANVFAALQQQSQSPRTLTSWFTITWPFTVDAIRNETVYIPVRRRWGKRRLQYRKLDSVRDKLMTLTYFILLLFNAQAPSNTLSSLIFINSLCLQQYFSFAFFFVKVQSFPSRFFSTQQTGNNLMQIPYSNGHLYVACIMHMHNIMLLPLNSS